MKLRGGRDPLCLYAFADSLIHFTICSFSLVADEFESTTGAVLKFENSKYNEIDSRNRREWCMFIRLQSRIQMTTTAATPRKRKQKREEKRKPRRKSQFSADDDSNVDHGRDVLLSGSMCYDL